MAGRQRADTTAQRLCATCQRRAVERAAGRRTFLPLHQQVTAPVAQALAVFQNLQLARRIQLDVGIAADAVAPARSQIVHPVEDTVAQIGLGQRTQPGDRARRRQRGGLRGQQVRRMHQAPAPVHLLVLQQPFDRPAARPGEAGFDLLHLLGDVDMDRSVRDHPGQRRDLLRRCRAQAVRGEAQPRIRQGGERLPGPFQQPRETVEIVHEAALPLGRR